MTRRHEVLTTVLEAIAESEDCTPNDIEYSLYDHVEIGALLTLATSDHDGWELAFEVPDHTVTVRGDGQVLVDGTPRGELTRQSQQVVE
jgi:hypothetical protein